MTPLKQTRKTKQISERKAVELMGDVEHFKEMVSQITEITGRGEEIFSRHELVIAMGSMINLYAVRNKYPDYKLIQREFDRQIEYDINRRLKF